MFLVDVHMSTDVYTRNDVTAELDIVSALRPMVYVYTCV
jgi:hypothetical protein